MATLFANAEQDPFSGFLGSEWKVSETAPGSWDAKKAFDEFADFMDYQSEFAVLLENKADGIQVNLDVAVFLEPDIVVQKLHILSTFSKALGKADIEMRLSMYDCDD